VKAAIIACPHTLFAKRRCLPPIARAMIAVAPVPIDETISPASQAM